MNQLSKDHQVAHETFWHGFCYFIIIMVCTVPRIRPGFTLIEVVVAMAVLALISAGLLATTWRLVGIARDYVDCTVADSYCHDVIYAATASTCKFGLPWSKELEIEWTIEPTNELPRIVSVDLFNREKVVYPLWREEDVNHKPKCTIRYPTQTNISVTVSWDWDDKTGSYRGSREAMGGCR